MSINHVPKFTASSFNKAKGILYLGCQQISIYKAVIDSQKEIENLQIETLSKAMAKERMN